MKSIEDLKIERLRQINEEGWTEEHDDQHSSGQLALAAAVYALAGSSEWDGDFDRSLFDRLWPYSWSENWFKPTTTRRRNLIKAGALILAEIDRLDRR